MKPLTISDALRYLTELMRAWFEASSLVKDHRGLVGYDFLATGRRLQVRLGNTLSPLSEMSALRCNSKTTAFNEKQIPDNTFSSHQLMHFHIQLCISILSYIKIT
jgi:hypothetical protein